MTLLRTRGAEWGVEGRRIVGPLDLEIGAGESVGIIGSNGAGKTSLLRLLVGAVSPASGAVELDGRELGAWRSKARARRVAYVPQLRPVDVPLSVRELLLSARYPYLSPGRLAPARSDFEAVSEAARKVGVTGLLDRPLSELSGGERQCAYIAAAVAQAGDVLLLDEPTTHLDAGNRRRVASLLLDLRRDGAHTLVVATHDLRFAARLCDRLIALRDGQMIAAAPPADVLQPSLLARLFDAPFSLRQEDGEILPLLALDAREGE